MSHPGRYSFAMAPIVAAALLAACAQQPVDPPARSLSTIQVTPSDETIPATSTLAYAAIATYSDGTTEDKTSAVAWSSSDAGVATIDAGTGEATGVNDGTATVEASLDGVTGSTSLTVVSLDALEVTPAAMRLLVGGSGQLTATATTKKGASFDATDFVEWKSDDASIASVGDAAPSRGAVSGVSDGSATVTASIAALSADAAVTVASLASLSITPASATASVGGTQQFTATGNYSDEMTEDLTETEEAEFDDFYLRRLRPQERAAVLRRLAA